MWVGVVVCSACGCLMLHAYWDHLVGILICDGESHVTLSRKLEVFLEKVHVVRLDVPKSTEEV